MNTILYEVDNSEKAVGNYHSLLHLPFYKQGQ